MIKESDIKRMADNLFDAEKKRKQIGLISSNFPEMTLKDAYAIQEKLIDTSVESTPVIFMIVSIPIIFFGTKLLKTKPRKPKKNYLEDYD